MDPWLIYAATPPPDSYGNFDRMPYKQNATNGPSHLKPGRAPPPRVDTGAASRFHFLLKRALY